ncbi:CPBP family intramembrane metalloprotease [Patescibacteria group bacterium]|nr:CPBP family intramembrane metalloprotease [Patescibacteria group bacterium]
MFINKLINRYKSFNYLQSILELSLLAFIIKLPLSFLGMFLVQALGIEGIDIFSANMQIPEITYEAFILGVFWAPVIETLIAQSLVLFLLSRLGFGTNFKVFFSAFIFALMHLPVIEFLPSAFGVGFFLAITYLSKDSKKYLPYISTVLVHALHNALAFLLISLFT